MNENSHKDNVTIGRIRYMNVAPVYFGLDNGLRPEWMNLVRGVPSELNAAMATGRLDISPVSVFAYARHQDEWMLMPDLSVSCFGPVMSVRLLSREAFGGLHNKTVWLTEESETAAALTKLLFARRSVTPIFEPATIREPKDIPERVSAALVIGDTALKFAWHRHFLYDLDLGDMWLRETGLPFVFAVWVVRKSLAAEKPDAVSAVSTLFRESKRNGLDHLDEISTQASEKLGISRYTCLQYYNRLDYSLNPLKIQGMETFMDGLCRTGLIDRPVHMSVFNERV